MTGVKRGEIYYIERSYTQVGNEQFDGRPAIIVSNDRNNENSYTVEVVYLTTQPKNDLPTHVEIRSAKKPSTALCEQVTTLAAEKIGDYIGTCTDSEMEAIDVALAISLGITFEEPECKEEINPEVPVVKEVPVVDTETRNALIKTEAERDVYKSLYEKLLKKALKAD